MEKVSAKNGKEGVINGKRGSNCKCPERAKYE
jgi:hypothetical protein